MHLIRSLTTVLPLSRLTAFKPKNGHVHTFGESPTTHALASSTTLSGSPIKPSVEPHTQSQSPKTSRALSTLSTSVSHHKTSALTQATTPAPSPTPPISSTDAPAHSLAGHVPDCPDALPNLPNAAQLNAHFGPQPSTTILELSLVLPQTTYYLTTVAPEIDFDPGNTSRDRPSMYLSGSLVFSGSINTAATAPDVIMGGSWEGVVASSSVSSKVAVVATASVPLPGMTKTGTSLALEKSNGAVLPTPQMTVTVTVGAVTGATESSKAISSSRTISASSNLISIGSSTSSAALTSSVSSSSTSTSTSTSTSSTSNSRDPPSSSAESTSTTFQTSTTSSSNEEKAWWRLKARDEVALTPTEPHRVPHRVSPTPVSNMPIEIQKSPNSANRLCERVGDEEGEGRWACPTVLTESSY